MKIKSQENYESVSTDKGIKEHKVITIHIHINYKLKM